MKGGDGQARGFDDANLQNPGWWAIVGIVTVIFILILPPGGPRQQTPKG